MKNNKTLYAKTGQVARSWYLIDAADKILGRLAGRIAVRLRGKHKAIFSPHVDCGDFVVVINAAKVRVTGKKAEQKIYFSHSGYPGGDKQIAFEKMIVWHPEKVLLGAVAGMLPKNRLGRAMLKKLKVYRGTAHPHQAQKLKKLEV